MNERRARLDDNVGAEQRWCMSQNQCPIKSKPEFHLSRRNTYTHHILIYICKPCDTAVYENDIQRRYGDEIGRAEEQGAKIARKSKQG